MSRGTRSTAVALLLVAGTVAGREWANLCDDNLNGTSFDSNSFPAPGGAIACDIVH
jgi:hypothetical protein